MESKTGLLIHIHIEQLFVVTSKCCKKFAQEYQAITVK